MCRNSRSLILPFKKKSVGEFERSFCSGGGHLNKPIFRRSNVRGVVGGGGNVEASNWSTHLSNVTHIEGPKKWVVELTGDFERQRAHPTKVYPGLWPEVLLLLWGRMPVYHCVTFWQFVSWVTRGTLTRQGVELGPFNPQMNKVGKFLKKLWCCVGGRAEQGNLELSTELIT